MAMSQTDKDKQYDRAITLIQYYVQLMWFIFGAFLLAETVLLGAVASVAKDGSKPASLGFGGRRFVTHDSMVDVISLQSQSLPVADCGSIAIGA